VVPKSIKELEEIKITWNDRNLVRLDYENEIRICFKNKFAECFEKVKNDFEYMFPATEYAINKNKNIWSASLNSFRIEFCIDTPSSILEKHKFDLIIVREQRSLFHIVIFSSCNIYFPKIGTHREQPKSIELIKNDIQRMNDEMLIMDENKKRIKESSCVFACYSGKNLKPSDYRELKKYMTFREVLKELLKS